jgi:hypothetical protein
VPSRGVGKEPITCAALRGVSGRRAAGVVGGGAGAGRKVPARLGFGGRHAGGLAARAIGLDSSIARGRGSGVRGFCDVRGVV